jgi:hypothetical protein
MIATATGIAVIAVISVSGSVVRAGVVISFESVTCILRGLRMLSVWKRIVVLLLIHKEASFDLCI